MSDLAAATRRATPGATQASVPCASVIVPTWNEAANLPELVARIFAAVPGCEIVVVDDDSSDDTARVAASLHSMGPIRVVERRWERGLSSAVLRGVCEARSDRCVVLDADLSHPPEKIPDLLRALDEGADIAVGSRYVPGGSIDEWPLLRRTFSRSGSMLARPLTAVADPMAGFFCVRKSLLRNLKLQPRGFKILLEILARAPGAVTREIPIGFEDRRKGTSKFSARQRREFLLQVLDLYVATNALPARLAKFAIVGLSGAGIHLSVLIALVELAGLSRFTANLAGFLVAVTSNFALNRTWTFRAAHVGVPGAWLKSLAAALFGLAVQNLMLTVFPHSRYAFAASLAIAASTTVNFLAANVLVFNARPPGAGAPPA